MNPTKLECLARRHVSEECLFFVSVSPQTCWEFGCSQTCLRRVCLTRRPSRLPGMSTSSPLPTVINLSDCPTDWKEMWAGQTSWSFIVFVTVICLVGVCGCLLLAAIGGRLSKHSSRHTQLFVRNMGCPPQLKLPPECNWHLFLSHTWANGQAPLCALPMYRYAPCQCTATSRYILVHL